MAICQVVENPNAKDVKLFPVSGAGANIPVGTIMMPGATNGTNEAVAIPVTSSSNADAIGVLAEKHNYSASGDATQATLVSWFANGVMGSTNTAFPSHPIELCNNAVVIRVDYDLASTVAVASAISTALTVTGSVAGFGGSFVYYNAGTGIGQLVFIKSSTTDTLTLVGATGTTADNTTKITQILPIFHNLVVWLVNTTTVPTKLGSVAGEGSGRALILGQYIQRNNVEERMDPKVCHGLTGLNSLTTLNMYAKLMIQDSCFDPID